ncbi:hypothetical protein STEG23_025908 [Scotinomys teguina]
MGLENTKQGQKMHTTSERVQANMKQKYVEINEQLCERTGVFSSCCLALDSSSSFPCPAFLAIAKSVSFICGLTHTELPKLLPS